MECIWHFSCKKQVVHRQKLRFSDGLGGGIEAKAATGNGIITDERLNELNETYFKDKEYNRVSVHDPSIVTGYIDEKNYTGSEHVYGV